MEVIFEKTWKGVREEGQQLSGGRTFQAERIASAKALWQESV